MMKSAKGVVESLSGFELLVFANFIYVELSLEMFCGF